MSDTQNGAKFPVREVRELVKDLMPPNAFIYWSDFLFHITLAWGAFVFCFRSEPFSLGQWISFFVAVFAFFRSAIFIHELTHLRKGTFQAFRVVWNVLCGFPLMIPSFLYEGVHNDHHNIHLYGTDRDGEYFPFVKEGRQKIILFVLVSFVLPVFFFFRAVVLTPLSYCHKGVRSFILERASSFSIDLSYKRTLSSLKSVPMWQTQEAVACLYGWGYVWLIGQGILPYEVLGFWFCIFGVIFFVNSLRTLAAHCYRNSGDESLDISGQLLDSVNVPASLFGVFWAPVGLRFHATHHLIPEMPYHSLAKTHERLMERFSQNNPYSQATSPSLGSALCRLWQEARN